MKTGKKLLTGSLLALCAALLVLCIVLAAGWSKAAKTDTALPEVRNNGTAIQWKYSDEADWHDLVALTELRGAAGEAGKDGANGKDGINAKSIEVQRAATHIQWRYAGDEWQNLVAIVDITGPAGQSGKGGANGKTPEIRVNENTLQWRYTGDEIWLNLYDLSVLKGLDGKDGTDGATGKDGKTPFIGENGNWFVGNDTAVQVDVCDQPSLLESSGNRFVNNGYDMVNNSGKTIWMSQNFFYHDYDATDSEAEWNPILWEQKEVKGEDDKTVVILQLKHDGENGAVIAGNDAPEFTIIEDYNRDPEYFNFLPLFDGNDKTLAYPLARTQNCNTFFRPNYRDKSCPSWQSLDDPYYPSYVQQGVTISENELDGLRFSSYDSETDTAVGTFDFGSSRAETEH